MVITMLLMPSAPALVTGFLAKLAIWSRWLRTRSATAMTGLRPVSLAFFAQAMA